jgi:hypothetical protein
MTAAAGACFVMVCFSFLFFHGPLYMIAGRITPDVMVQLSPCASAFLNRKSMLGNTLVLVLTQRSPA